MRILVAEDEPGLSQQLSVSLREAGYAVDAAGDGARADFLARTEQYDAILLDLGGVVARHARRASAVHLAEPLAKLTNR